MISLAADICSANVDQSYGTFVFNLLNARGNLLKCHRSDLKAGHVPVSAPDLADCGNPLACRHQKGQSKEGRRDATAISGAFRSLTMNQKGMGMGKHDEGRRAFLGTAIGASVAASSVLAPEARAQAVTATKTILAVAIGDSGKSEEVYTEAQLEGKRPYLKGIVDRLKTITVPGSNPARNYALGRAGDYVIDYREFAPNELDGKDSFKPNASLPADFLIFAMSTTVAWSALRHETVKPIVAIVSNAKDVGIYADNVCGVSGKRSQYGRDYYEKFLKTVATPALTKVYVLVKEGYAPCLDALRLIEQSNVGPGPTVVNVSRPGAIESAITYLDKNSGGLLILPADWFFAARQEITEWARQQQLPDFWPVADWVIGDQKSPLGGFGVSQQKCGELLGEQIAEVWKNGIPKGSGKRWVYVKDGDREWKASQKAANSLGITLGPVTTIIP